MIAATLAVDGTIREPNPALQRLAAREPAGVPLSKLIEPSQHPALARRLAAADAHWRPAVFAFLAAAGRPSIDRRLWLARAGEDLLVIGEPVTDEQERLVEKVLELNDEAGLHAFTGDLPGLVAAMVPPEGVLRDDIAVLVVRRTH